MPRNTRRHWTRPLAIISLEDRLAPSVTFNGADPVAPVANTTDLVLGTVSGFVPIEPMISVNPTDPTNLIVTSHNGMKISTNGGLTFPTSATFQNPGGTTSTGGDTDTTFDAQGRLFWANLAGSGTLGVSASQVNPTTGAAIGPSVLISNASDDKEFLAADTSPTSPFSGNLYVAWTRFGVSPPEVFFSRSTDHGVSWSVPIQLSMPADSFSWPVDVGVAPNGDVYVAYHSQPGFVGNTPDGTSGMVFVMRSTDGGVTFTQKTNAFNPGAADITFNVQGSGGTIPQTQFWTQGSAQPWVLPDPVRPGNVYVVAVDDPDNNHSSGDASNVVISRSTNNGLNWSTATIEAGPSNSFQLFPSAAIDRFGNIVVAWYDNRRGLVNASNRFLLDVFATYSTDGGVTWATPFQVNDPSNPFDPDNGAVNRFFPPPTTRIGEYFGIALYGNTAHLAWNGTTTGHKVVYDSFPLAGTLTVNGDDAGPTSDNIVIRKMAANTNYLEVLVNGVRQYAGLAAGLIGINVSGGAGDDTLTVDFSNGAFTLSGGVQFDGGSGTDTFVGPNAAANWLINTPGGGTMASAGLGVSTFANVENLIGGGLNDSFTFANGGTLGGAINGAGGSDTLTADDGSRNFALLGTNSGIMTGILSGGFSNIENLTGGAGANLLLFAIGSLTGSFDGGGGTDTVDMSALSSQSLTVLGEGTIDGLNLTGGTNVGGGLFNVDTVVGSAAGLNDVLVGLGADSTWTLSDTGGGAYAVNATGRTAFFNGFEFLAGGSAADRLVPLLSGSLLGSFDGGGGFDTADFSALGGQQFVLTGFGATDGYTLGGPSVVGGLTNIDAIVGGAGPDTLTGLNVIPFWTLTGADAGSYVDQAFNRSLSFASIENLVGGNTFDFFFFQGGSLTGTIDGGGGDNTIVTDNVGRNFTLTGPDGGTIGGILPAGFTAIGELHAGSGADALVFLSGGSLSSGFNGGPGTDTADFSAVGSQQFILNSVDAAGEFEVNGIPGVFGFLLSMNALIGSALGTTDRLIGLDRPTTWQISGPNSGTYIDDVIGASLAFSNIEYLTDGSAPATFQLLPGGSLSGVFDAGAGTDTLDLSAFPGQQVQITGLSAIDGFDLLPILPIAGGFADIDRLIASPKSLTDRLTGLDGGNGWQLRAGTDQNLCSSGGHTMFFAGFDQLYGGSNADVLVVDFSAGIPILASGITFNGRGGADSVVAVGTGAADMFRLTTTALRVNGRPIRYSGVESIEIHGDAGKDVFSSASATLPAVLTGVSFFGENGDDTAVVTPALSALLHVDGGAGKDTLKIARGAAISLAPLPPRGAISGTYLFKNRKAIEFEGIEVRAIGASQVFP